LILIFIFSFPATLT